MHAKLPMHFRWNDHDSSILLKVVFIDHDSRISNRLGVSNRDGANVMLESNFLRIYANMKNSYCKNIKMNPWKLNFEFFQRTSKLHFSYSLRELIGWPAIQFFQFIICNTFEKVYFLVGMKIHQMNRRKYNFEFSPPNFKNLFFQWKRLIYYLEIIDGI